MDAQIYNRFSSLLFNLLLLSACWTVMQASAAEPEQQKNHEAVYVAVEQARLYAGPSSDFYPTGDAKRGTVLEVYHRTDNGWLGVRPPQGSFSWVPASQAYLLPGGRVIEITDASAVSWIGTELGSAKQYRWQVQLKVGEQLSLLGEATIKSETDDREALWYKVSPPAGEFRWIEKAAISKSAPPVNPTGGPSESLAATGVKSVSASAGAAPGESSTDDEKNADAENGKSEKSVVQSASFERPAAAPRSQKGLSSNATKSDAGNSRPESAGRNGSPRKNEWDGWYAFEMSENGVRTPFLDKLSGRDRGPSSKSAQPTAAPRDPLLNDPFSLAMVGEPETPLPSASIHSETQRIEARYGEARYGEARRSNPMNSEAMNAELKAVVKNQREWRDPRSLRDARLGSVESTLGSMAASRDRNAPTNAPRVLLASSERSTNATVGSAVNTAGYDQNEMQSVDAAQAQRDNVNWYGLVEGSSIASPSSMPSSALNVVTSTADVGELQLALSHAVASSNGLWNLAPLAERARYLIEHGPTAIDRGQARLLLDRIDAFQSVSVRTQQITRATSPQSNPVQSTSFNATTQNRSLPDSPQTVSAIYEATGWLVPVYAAAPDQPTHALTNDTGDVVAYVSPIAGLNLDRYRNQAVGINGLRGYLPQLQAAHIQAQRVSRVR